MTGEQTTFLETDTLAAAKNDVRARRREGVMCPCCGRYVREYRRTITSSMALGLIEVAKWYDANNVPSSSTVHVEKMLAKTTLPVSARGDVAKLVHWGMLAHASTEGYYRLTETGRAFVNGTARVQKYVWIYNKDPQGFEGDMIGIEEALGEPFSYRKLMGGWDCIERSCENCASNEDGHYCLLHTKVLKNANINVCDDWTEAT